MFSSLAVFSVLLCILSVLPSPCELYVLCVALCAIYVVSYSLCCSVFAPTMALTFLLVYIGAVGTLTSVPETTDGVLTVCPGDSISITCTHDNVAGQLTRWIIPGVNFSCTVVHDGSPPPNCSPFNITMISNSSGLTLSFTAQIVATESLNSTEVECLAGGLLTTPQVGNITVRVIGKQEIHILYVSLIIHLSLSRLPICADNWSY